MRDAVDTQREYANAVNDYERMGWEIDARESGRTVLQRGLRGGWLWHLLFFLIVPIIGNLCYSAFRRYDRPEYVVVRLRGTREDDESDAVDDAREAGGSPS